MGEGEDFYHSCGAYEFLFGRAEGAWKITSITQRALQSWGQSATARRHAQGRSPTH